MSTNPDSSTVTNPSADAASAAEMGVRDTVLVLALIVGTILVMAGVVVGSVKYFDANPPWLGRDVAVQQELNERYVEDIEVVRSIEGGGRSGRLIETITIDGVVRGDCKVHDDSDPSIVCDAPLTLTPEPASGR